MNNLFAKSSVIIFFLLSAALSAQNSVFTVIALQGDVKITGAKTQKKTLRQGDGLLKDQVINLNRGGYICLRHRNGLGLELAKEGNYAVSDLEKRSSEKNSGLLQKYSNFVVKELTSKSSAVGEMKMVGAVERGAEDKILLSFPGDTFIYNDTLLITWFANNKAGEYLMKALNDKDNVVASWRTKDTMISFRMVSPQFLPDRTYRVKIESAMNPLIQSEVCSVIKMPELTALEIKKQYRQMLEQTDPSSAFDMTLIASFFEKSQLMYDAAKYYKAAVTMRPGVEAYEKLYKEFLIRNSMN